ncbi:Fic/DOC family protein [Secundilactobacillus similis]|uniref:Fic/DOC family protein n=1 Tax=Secundilactobacillus similis TaxID=414682 RepID=UPI0006D195EC|nr:Fic family protein [Secundilactobacillus similis]
MSWITDTLQGNGTLINKLNITNAHRLFIAESRISQVRYQEIIDHPITIKDIESLKVIHYKLFGDIYSWAGEFRTGNFHKYSTEFFPVSRFKYAIEDLNTQISHFNRQSYHSTETQLYDLAQLLLDIKMFHPFREGNGRTQRLFITLIAEQNGITLHLKKSSPAYDSYMQAAVADNLKMMVEALTKAITNDI